MKKGKLISKIFAIALVLVLIGAMVGGLPALVGKAEASPATIYVPDSYPTIQAAVDAASPGDTIIVRDGTYTENIDVNKDHLTIQSQSGAEVTIVRAANPNDHVFSITADSVNIDGFTIRDATEVSAISLYHVKHCNISDNKVMNNRSGISLQSSSNNAISDNTCNSNAMWGIYLHSSNNNILSGNTCNFNSYCGIQLDTSSSINTLSGNTCNSNDCSGIILVSSSNDVTDNTCNLNKYCGIELSCSSNTLADNTCNSNYLGIQLSHSSSNSLTNNTATDNYDGIYLFPSSNNDNLMNNAVTNNRHWGIFVSSSGCNLINNTATHNDGGIKLGFASNNTVTSNNVLSNMRFGIMLDDSDNNKIYLNNLIDNSQNAYDDTGTNAWTSTRRITYKYNGNTHTSYLGNYWSDYAGSDINGDGIGETPYPIDSDADTYPLTEPFENYGVGPSERELWGIPVDFRFGEDLEEGNYSPEVRYLQIVLNSDPETQLAGDGSGSLGEETTVFDSLPKEAVIKFQIKHGIIASRDDAGAGRVGPKTRAKLNEILESLFEGHIEAFRLLSKEERESAIFQSIKTNKGDFLPEDFPMELVLAIAAQETGEYAHWNNEHVADDWGRGIMQITSNTYVGAGSGCTSEDCTECKDRTKKIYCSQFYPNTVEGIDANIKDGLYALEEKYNAAATHYNRCINGELGYSKCTEYGVSCDGMCWISAVQRYHSYFKHPQYDPQRYLKGIAEKLENLTDWFPSADSIVATQLAEKVRKVWENSEQIVVFSPVDLQVHDSNEQITGLINGEVSEEIPFSVYYEQSNVIMIPFADESYRYQIVGVEEGTYGLEITSAKNGETTNFTATDIPTAPGAVHQYTIDWDALSQGEEGVTVYVDSDGDGVFERMFTSDEELTQDEFLSQLPGCFIATAAYGTPMAEEIQILREFRDKYLLTNPPGQVLVDIYYRVSPPMAEFITEHPCLKPIVRAGLVPAVAMSTIVVNTTPAEKMVIVGLLALVSVAMAVWAKRRRGRGPQYT